MARIAVIGGAGFIGTALIAHLKGHAQLRIVDRSARAVDGMETAVADIRDRAALHAALEGSDEIIHLAAAHRDDVRPESEYHSVNVGGMVNICAVAAALGIRRIVYTSSVAVYGMGGGCQDEQSEPCPFNAYGASKLQSEIVLRNWQNSAPDSRQALIVRPTAVFGPGNRANVYNLMTMLARRRFVMIGDGGNRKSIAYVGNVGAFLAFLARRPFQPGAQIVNYCDKPDLSMTEFATLVRGALGLKITPDLRLPVSMALSLARIIDIAAAISRREFPVSRTRVEKFCAETVVDAAAAEGTGFIRPYNMQDALRSTVRSELG